MNILETFPRLTVLFFLNAEMMGNMMFVRLRQGRKKNVTPPGGGMMSAVGTGGVGWVWRSTHTYNLIKLGSL